MKMRIFVVVAIIVFAIQAHAGSTLCTSATSLVPDGRLLDFDSVQPNNTSNWYQFTAIAGRSYSVEVRDDLDSTTNDLQVTYYGPNSTCSSLVAIPTSTASVTDTHAMEPVLPASSSAWRSSIVTCAPNFPAATGCTSTSNGGGTYLIKVQNTSTTTSHYVSVSVTETTLYSSYWNTNAGFNTQWVLQNTTSQAVNFTITLTSMTPVAPVTYTSALMSLGAAPSGWQILGTTGTTFTPALPTTQGQIGYLTITHNGPPGAIQAFASEYNFGYASPVQFQVSIGPIHGK